MIANRFAAFGLDDRRQHFGDRRAYRGRLGRGEILATGVLIPKAADAGLDSAAARSLAGELLAAAELAAPR